VVHGASFFVVGGQVAIHDGKQRSIIEQPTKNYPLTLTVTGATRCQNKSGVKTVGEGILESIIGGSSCPSR
jgi:hypothetical protein